MTKRIIDKTFTAWLTILGFSILFTLAKANADACIDENDFQPSLFGKYDVSLLVSLKQNEVFKGKSKPAKYYEGACPKGAPCYLLHYVDERSCTLIKPNGDVLELQRYYEFKKDEILPAILGEWSFDNCKTQRHTFYKDGTAYYWQNIYEEGDVFYYSNYGEKWGKLVETILDPNQGEVIKRYELFMNYNQDSLVGSLSSSPRSLSEQLEYRSPMFFQKRCT